MGEQYVNVI